MSYFTAKGVPPQIPLIIGYMESGLRNIYNDAADGYPSYGVFQANTAGGMGEGHDPQSLLDPNYNIANTGIGDAIVNAFNNAGGIEGWRKAQAGGEGAISQFIQTIHLKSLIPHEWSMRQNYAANWGGAIGELEAFKNGGGFSGGGGGGYSGGGDSPVGAAFGIYDPANITSGFMEPFYLDSGGVNKGLDFGVPGGTPIPVTVSGTVVLAGDDGAGWGPRVLVKDSNGIYHSFGHMQNLQVQEGDRVGPGTIIGEVGEGIVGTSTGPHLSYDVYRMGQNGQEWIDPMSFLDEDLGALGAGYNAIEITKDMFGGYFGNMAEEYLTQLETFADPLGMLDENGQPKDGSKIMTTDEMLGAANMAAQQAFAIGKLLERGQAEAGEDWPMVQEYNEFTQQTTSRPKTVEELQKEQAGFLKTADDWNKYAAANDVGGGDAFTLTVSNGVASIAIDPTDYANLDPATQAFIDQTLENQGTELYNSYVDSYNSTVRDEYDLATAYAEFQNGIETQLYDWAVDNQININNVAQLNHELERQYGMDINDYIQRNWENSLSGWQSGVDVNQLNWDNQVRADEIANNLLLTLHDLSRAYGQDETNRLMAEYDNKIRYFDNLLKYDQATQQLVDRQLSRWFGIKEQSQQRAEFITSQAPWMTPMGQTSFTPEGLGSIATAMAEMAQLDPNAALINYTGQVNPQQLMENFDAAMGAAGPAPDYAPAVAGLGDIPGVPTLPESVKPPGADQFQTPPAPPIHAGPPNVPTQGVTWDAPPTLGWDVDVPGREDLFAPGTPGALLQQQMPNWENMNPWDIVPKIIGANSMPPGSIYMPTGHSGLVYGEHSHTGGAEQFLDNGRPVPVGMTPGEFDPFNRASLPDSWGRHRFNQMNKRHPMFDPTAMLGFGGR